MQTDMSPLSRAFSFLLLSTLFSGLHASDFEVSHLQERILTTIDLVQPAVVSVRQRGGMFSGVIISKEGHILSAGHAVSPGATYQVWLPDGRRFSARGKGSNPRADCALLKITSEFKELPYVRMGDSSGLVRNQPCLSISFPGGQGTRGVPVVRFGRVVQAGRGNRMLQSTALMEPGDSGGPLFDLQGRVIGIHSRIGQSMSRNFEVPINTFKTFWNELNQEASFTEKGPPVPKLGFLGQDRGDGVGIVITEVIEDSLAKKHGLEPNDIIQKVGEQETKTITKLREALIAARDNNTEELIVKIIRAEEGMEVNIPFDVQRTAADKVEMPVYEEKEFDEPRAIDQLVNLPAEFKDLESQLDDACIEVSSSLADGTATKIVGTLIRDTPFIVSKSSMVHSKPTFASGDESIDLQVVSRDTDNDLVLLKAPSENTAGVDLTTESGETPEIGRFLITPDLTGPGLVSIVSTKAFNSPKQQSRGYLGVVPADYKNKKGAILEEVTDDGAAKRAGLQVGDVITKMNETAIATQMELRQFLGALDPNATVVAQVRRGDKKIEKTIRLGAFPSMSNHAADRMDKSGRRDGFATVIPHDADLKPAKCGGPLFDLEGNFIGLNIARNSRVRSYAIPSVLIKELIPATK